MKRSLVSMAILFSLAFPALAQSPRDSIFPNDQGCYLRHYTNSHLAKHPDQLVTEIAIGAQQGFGRDDRVIILDVALYLRGSDERFVASAYCENEAGHLFCGMEGDAGAFTLVAAEDGAVLLKVARRGMAFEGARDFIQISGTSGDDRSFLMPRVPADSCP